MSTNLQFNIKITKLTKSSFDEAFEKAFEMEGLKRFDNVRSSMHFWLLSGYLFWDKDGLRAKTMVEEEDYYSLSYAGDYKNYYAQCFKTYKNTCKRIHFFNKDISYSKLEKLLRINENSDGKEDEELKECYLGYIVVKPLMKGYIGATLLKTYAQKNDRFYTAIRKYPVNLFGKQIILKSLPFQEQDQIVASCATSALWFGFHKTGELFQSKIPNPSDITVSAGVNFNSAGWFFPSDSLTTEQIGKAIYSNDMVSAIQVQQEYLQHNRWIKSFIYAFSRMGVPVLLGLSIDSKDDQHMVTVNGYRVDPIRVGAENGINEIENTHGHKSARNEGQVERELKKLDSLQLLSDSIIKFYAHDDQVGPFARLEFIPETSRVIDDSKLKDTENDEIPRYQFTTSWFKENGVTEEGYQAYATTVIIPLAKSILVPYQSIMGQVARLNLDMDNFWEKNGADFQFVWDIYLNSSTIYKKELRGLMQKGKYNINASKPLYKALPEYIWVVKCYLDIKDHPAELLFDIIYDASDVDVLNSFHTNFYNESFKSLLDVYGVWKNDRIEFSDVY